MNTKKINPHILKYMEEVENEKIRTCEEQKKLVAHIRDVFAKEDIYTDDEQLEHYLNLANYFDYERLYSWEEFLTGLFMCTYKKSDGRPRFRELFCMIGRGAGKDGFIAFLGLCAISKYNTVKKYNVDICAYNEAQALRPVLDVVEMLSEPANKTKLKPFFEWKKEEVKGKNNKSRLKGYTNNAKGKDGLRSAMVIFNELHTYEDTANINVFTTGKGKIKHPRTASFTTQGDIRDGPLDEKLSRAAKVLGGEPDRGFLPFICKLDSKEEVNDQENWQKANPSLPYLPDLYDETLDEYEMWKENPRQLPAFMTKRMNIPQGRSDTEVAKWEDIKATDRPLPDLTGRQCTVGIDYATTRDMVGVNFHFCIGSDRYDINHAWLNTKNNNDLPRIKAPYADWANPDIYPDTPLTLVQDDNIQPQRIADYIQQMGKKYKIMGIACDKFRFELLRAPLEKIGFDADKRKNIKLTRPSDIMTVQPVIDNLFVNRQMSWGDNPVLRWAANNTKLVAKGRKDGTDTGNFYYAKIEAKSRKTDPFMALVASVCIENKIKQNRPESYGNIDLMVW